MKKQRSIIIFWMLVVVSLIVASEFFLEPVTEFLSKGPVVFLAPIFLFFLFGALLLIFTLKEKVANPLRKFFILTGASSTVFFIAILLHNLIYALFIYLFGKNFWEQVGLGDEPFFFLVATIICPIGYLVGFIGSLVILIKNR